MKFLIFSKSYELIKVYTHSQKPFSEDPNHSMREEFSSFEQICKKNNISLVEINSKNDTLKNFPQCDFIIEVSWRFLISKEVIKKAKITAIGIHRGKLPQFAGAEPLKQALINHEKIIIVTAHYLDEVIDNGKSITSISHNVNYEKNYSLKENISRLKKEITPYYSKLTLDSFQQFV